MGFAQAGKSINTGANLAIQGLQPTGIAMKNVIAYRKNQILVNGNFENGFTGWTPTALVLDSTMPRSGTNSCLCINGNGVQSVTLTMSHTYMMSGWVKTNGNVVGGTSLGAGILWNNIDSSQLQILGVVGGTFQNLSDIFPAVVLGATVATDWTYIAMRCTVLTNVAFPFAFTDCYGGASPSLSSVWFDDLSLVDVTGIAETAAKPRKRKKAGG